ncbi:MAG: ABC-three component system protein [Rhodomicrobium sp.]
MNEAGNFSLCMTPAQTWQWRLSLDVKLRRLHGDALQDFFSTLMERVYGSDFIRVRSFGKLGDKGCDGYVSSAGQMYQCYGKIGDAALNVALLIAKMNGDFSKAHKNFGSIMRGWHFVHNLLDGVPSEVVTTIEELKSKNAKYEFGHAGYEWFWSKICSLSEAYITEFLGPAATAEDTHGLNMAEVKKLLASLTKDIHEAPIDEGNPGRVPTDKLEFNNLADHWRYFIRSGTPNAPHVAKYFDRHNDPELGKLVAKIFRDRYEALKLQGLAPDAIMFELYVQTAGNGTVMPERQVAVQAILAYLFDSCDVFEEHPTSAGGL